MKYIKIRGAREHNLKNIDIDLPRDKFIVITGLSGSGKSTLAFDTLYAEGQRRYVESLSAYARQFLGLMNKPDIDSIEGLSPAISIEQKTTSHNPRSNPATYIKVFDDIRYLFASTKEAKMRGYPAGRFSFNVPGGRCEKCQGNGTIKIEMNFLPDIYVECEECKGKRFNAETLKVTYKEKSIADVLDMTVSEALELFSAIPSVQRKFQTLVDVGLGYIKVGQSATTLSGGEAQRIKLTKELSKRATGKTIYLLDEPTTGLHFHDVNKLLEVLHNLVNKGNTILIIEHNLDVIKSADYIIDLGPEGGDAGGQIVAIGTPEEVAKNPKSYTGIFLKEMLKNNK